MAAKRPRSYLASGSVSVGKAALERDAIPDRYKWDLSRIFPDWPTWEDAFAAIERTLPDLESHRGRLDRSASDLLGAIEAILDCRQRLEVVYIYASLKSDEDTRIGDNTSRRGRAGTLAVKFAEAVSWFEPEVLALTPQKLSRFEIDEPKLELYGHFLHKISRLREHTLSRDQESLLAAAANITRGSRQVFSALNNADLKFPNIQDEHGREIELTKARYTKYIKSPDRRVRRDAFEACLETYGGVINTLAANLDAHVKNHVFYTQARRYESSLEASLYPNAIETQVYRSLLETTRANLSDIHRFTGLKKRVLGLDPLFEYDLYTPLFPRAEIRFSYEEAQKLLVEACAPLGSEYLEIVRKAFTDRWLDVHENVGKRSGAYSNGVYLTSPYILLNWSEQLRDTFTLAHEMGHAVHTHLSSSNQPYVYAEYTVFTAEVASICNEMLLMHHLLERASSRDSKLYLLDYYLSQINDTVSRQVMFAEFELMIHEAGERGETLTAEDLSAWYRELLARFWGSDLALDNHLSNLNWSRIPHFYYNYYVYQYATAYAAAAMISRMILAGDVAARDRYLEFLKSGGRYFPVETLQRAGVDMTGPQPVEGVFALFRRLLDEIERLIEGEN